MLKKITKNLTSFLIIFIGLSFAGFISNLLTPNSDAFKTESSKNIIQKTTNTTSAAKLEINSKIKTVSYAIQNSTPPILAPSPTTSTIQINNSSSNIISETIQVTASSPTYLATPQIQITLSINEFSNFLVYVAEGANQCDVLIKALADGKISSLNMRYDSNFETYAVYQINGIGKENSVWWTYKVNSETPNQGCSFIKVKNEDSVEWKYIGS